MHELIPRIVAAEGRCEDPLPSPARFVYSGVLFEWIPPPDAASWQGPEDHPRPWHPSVVVGPMYASFLSAPGRSRPMARVSCVVSRAPGPRVQRTCDTVAETAPGQALGMESFGAARTELVAEQQGDCVTVWCGDAECVVRRIAQGEYVALARVQSAKADHGSVLAGVTSAVVHGEGGLFLHASVVQRSGRAIAFVGPSGEGKSTAARAMRGATLFSVDRAALVPTRSGWVVWSQPGGTLEQEDRVVRQTQGVTLQAVIRVRKSEQVAVRSYNPVEAMFALRESVLAWHTRHTRHTRYASHTSDASHPGHSREASATLENQLLSRVERLAHDVPVGELWFPKGVSVDERVDAWLSELAMREQWS